MSKIKQQIQELLAYYTGTRRAGHTTAVVDGAKLNDGIVLTHSREMSDFVNSNFEYDKTVTLQQLNKLRGNNKPLLLDNGTIHVLFSEVLKELNKKDAMEKALNKIKDIINKNV